MRVIAVAVLAALAAGCHGGARPVEAMNCRRVLETVLEISADDAKPLEAVENVEQILSTDDDLVCTGYGRWRYNGRPSYSAVKFWWSRGGDGQGWVGYREQ